MNWNKLLNPFIHLFHLFYPNLCVACGQSLIRGEKFLCINCLLGIPRTNMHKRKDNEIERRFWGKVNIEKATSYFYFTKGSKYLQILYELKYRNNKEIGQYIARCAAAEMLDSNIFADVDLIIPVPLHPSKLRTRGYNQCEWICKGLSDLLNIKYDTTHLVRTAANVTQTKKGVFDRHTNTKGIFEINNAADLEGKHILVVDDVLTTGSTLEGCIAELLKIKGATASVFTLAVAT